MYNEYENEFEGVSDEDMLIEKANMLNELKKYNIDISNDYDVKKAYELIKCGLN